MKKIWVTEHTHRGKRSKKSCTHTHADYKFVYYRAVWMNYMVCGKKEKMWIKLGSSYRMGIISLGHSRTCVKVSSRFRNEKQRDFYFSYMRLFITVRWVFLASNRRDSFRCVYSNGVLLLLCCCCCCCWSKRDDFRQILYIFRSSLL